jgi:hypothetical protein
LDTGSDKLVAKTWATIKHELKMVDGGIDDSVMPSPTVYAHNSSSTYVHLYMPKGKMPTRSDYSDPSARVDGLNKVPKRGYIAYGSGIAITEEGLDVVGVGGRQLPHFPLSEIAADSLSMLHTKQGISGILGLQHMKNKTLGQSVFTSMRQNGQMQAFGYCRGNDNDGTFIWGDKSTEGHEIPVIGQIHWALPLGMVRMTKGASTAQPSNEAPAGHRAHHHQSDEIVINGKDSGSDSQSSDGGGGDGAAAASGETQEPMRHARAPSMRWDMMPDPTHEGEAEGEREGSWEASSLAEKNGQPDEESGGITESSQTSSGGGDPDLKKEISDILGDVINKIVDKIEHRTQHKAAPAEEVTSKMVCGEGQSCAAIIDTGSNIIAGPSMALREMAKFVNVKYDCSNLDSLPMLKLTLGDYKVELPPKAYVMQVKLPKWAAGHGQGGGEGEGEGGGEGAGESLAQDAEGIAPQKLQPRGWHAAIAELTRSSGVVFDFASALQGLDIAALARADKLCMPAFAPLDKETGAGKLWVIGSPLFERYYTRWSYPKGADHPSIFLEDLKAAKTCGGQKAVAEEAPAEKKTEDVWQENNLAASRAEMAQKQQPRGLMRREVSEVEVDQALLDRGLQSNQQQESRKHKQESGMPPTLDLFEIRYPHWALELPDV